VIRRLGSARNRIATKYVTQRLVHAVFVVVAAYSVTFFLLFVLPGDAVLARIGSHEAVGNADIGNLNLDELRGELGLMDSLWVQYLRGLTGLLTLDLGQSLVSGVPVARLIFDALPSTLLLAGISLIVAVPLSLVFALAAVHPRSRWIRSLAALIPAAYVSLPVFWVGILLISLFSVTLGWLPAFGSRGWQSLVLPVTVLALGGAAQFAQVLISSLRSELGSSYAAVTAPAKGAGRFYTIMRHCLRNASFPFLTVLGLRIGTLLGGTVVVELVFSRKGIGRLIVDSVKSVDLTVVLGIVALIAIVYVVVNILVDFGYLLLDPRLRRVPAPVGG